MGDKHLLLDDQERLRRHHNAKERQVRRLAEMCSICYRHCQPYFEHSKRYRKFFFEDGLRSGFDLGVMTAGQDFTQVGLLDLEPMAELPGSADPVIVVQNLSSGRCRSVSLYEAQVYHRLGFSALVGATTSMLEQAFGQEIPVDPIDKPRWTPLSTELAHRLDLLRLGRAWSL